MEDSKEHNENEEFIMEKAASTKYQEEQKDCIHPVEGKNILVENFNLIFENNLVQSNIDEDKDEKICNKRKNEESTLHLQEVC